jgi:hypothetical protein
LCALVLCSGASASAFAQTLSTEIGALGGAGVERGGTKQHSVVQRAPMFLDASIRHWSDEDSRFILGGSMRVELEGAGSVGVMPRAELRFFFGKLELRPGIAGAFFFAPHTMFGPQTSLALRRKFSDSFGLLGMLDVSAFVIGSDVPKRSTVVIGALSLGIEMGL